MDENSLIAALRKAEEEKYAAVPAEEGIDHAFSDGFQQKMDRLIRLQRQSAWNMIKTPARRAFLLLLVLLLTFSVPAEKNPLFRLAQPIPRLNTALPAAPEASLPPRPSEDASAQPADQTTLHESIKPQPHTAPTEPFMPEEPATAVPPETHDLPEEPTTLPPETTRRSAAPAYKSEPEATTAPQNGQRQQTNADNQQDGPASEEGSAMESIKTAINETELPAAQESEPGSLYSSYLINLFEEMSRQESSAYAEEQASEITDPAPSAASP